MAPILVLVFLFCMDGNSQSINIFKDSVYSPVLKEVRPYWVNLPDSYNDSLNWHAKYPVIYLLDGDVHMHNLARTVQSQSSGVYGAYAMPEMIIVGISNTNRVRDLTPTHSTKMEGKDQAFLKSSGGGDNFLKFIKSELIPSIEKKYRTSPYRIFVGHSFGGLTVLHTLFTTPDAFQAYVAIDPSLWWDGNLLVKKGQDFFIHTPLKNKDLFIAQANTLAPEDTINNHYEAIQEFHTYLESRNYSNVRWNYTLYPDDSHGTVPFIACYDALRFIFKNYAIRVDRISGPDDMKKIFDSFSAEKNVRFYPPPKLVYSLAQYHLSKGEKNFALQYFQMLQDGYPQSAMTYLGLSEYWKQNGNPAKADEYWKKSKGANPKVKAP